MPRQSLGRLARADEFHRVYREGTRCVTLLLVVHIRPNGLPASRLGLVVGRRFGLATARNRLRRRMREAVRVNGPRIRKGVDMVVAPRENAAAATVAELRAAVETALHAASVLKETPGAKVP